MKKYILIAISFFVLSNAKAEKIQVHSPNDKFSIELSVGDSISLKAFQEEELLFQILDMRLILDRSGRKKKLKLKDYSIEDYNYTEEAIVPYKNRIVNQKFKLLTLYFKKLKLEVRVYEDGFAYRYVSDRRGDLDVVSETMSLEFPDASQIWHTGIDGFVSHYESIFQKMLIDSVPPNKNACLPLLFETRNNIKVLFSESDLYDYPNLFLRKGAGSQLRAVFPNIPDSIVDKDDRTEHIRSEKNYIASTSGKRSFPWRSFIIATEDKQIVASDMNWRLASSLKKKEECRWVKPGKVAWDWWSANNIYNVDFASGINNDTYKYYIDFASKYGLEYIILDEGWSPTTKINQSIEELDVPELVKYGEAKNVGLILWVLWKPLIRDLDSTLDLYKKWGVKGVKVDFMQRADQAMVNYYTAIAAAAFERKLVVDFHGSYKPSGLQKAYPNVLSFEGVKGLENVKWGKDITPEHNCTLPFVRMAAGPMDYTPGAMSNAHIHNYAIRWDRPMSMGTRAHQLALYVIYESPLQMLCDNPSAYYKEHESTAFISQIPVTWDETIVIDAAVGEYLVMARRKGGTWYLAAIGDQKEHTFSVDLDFLRETHYEVKIFEDGRNSNRNAEDYKIRKQTIDHTKTLKLKLAKGGGYCAIIKPKHY